MRWPAVFLVLLAACSSAPETTSRSGRTYATDTWYAAAPGPGSDEVTLTFDGPGPDCSPEREVAFTDAGDQVKAVIKRYFPSAVDACELVTQTITARLPAALGSRVLVSETTGWRFPGPGLTLDPASTPCARADCSTPAPTPASCEPANYDAVVAEQLGRREAPMQDARCDGSFLVLTRGRRAWFVNREASWQLVATETRSCAEVFRQTHIRFPASFC